MSLEVRINEDLKAAMKGGDKVAMRGIRAIKSAILLFKTDGSGRELDYALEIQLLQKLVKQRLDSLEIYQTQNRPDLAVTEEEEIAIIRKYLPEQLDDTALQSHIQAIVEEIGASGMKDMGKVMGLANQRLAGKAEGARIAVIVKSILAG
jgi:uncharacterized protein YqeY